MTTALLVPESVHFARALGFAAFEHQSAAAIMHKFRIQDRSAACAPSHDDAVVVSPTLTLAENSFTFVHSIRGLSILRQSPAEAMTRGYAKAGCATAWQSDGELDLLENLAVSDSDRDMFE